VRYVRRQIVADRFCAAQFSTISTIDIQCLRRRKPGSNHRTSKTFGLFLQKRAMRRNTYMQAQHFCRTRETGSRRLVLGPPLQCAQEVFPKDRTFNCTYELAYWRWGLETAQRWRERLGLAREGRWDAVLADLARPALADGKYLFAESAPDSYTDRRWARDHPAVAGALALVPGPGLDAEAMRRTLDWIDQNWDWPQTWGWDYPMLAMAAARLDQPQRAVDALLRDTPKNVYRANGHNHQRPGLTLYLPGNGGLLYAVAMMAAGWDGAPSRPNPGFPADGRWTVRWEGLKPAP